MRIILDTNVVISGIFFAGPPYQILKAWREGKLHLLISEEILAEYRRVGETLALQFPSIDLLPILDMLRANAELISVKCLPEPVCDDPDDDKFLAWEGNRGRIKLTNLFIKKQMGGTRGRPASGSFPQPNQNQSRETLAGWSVPRYSRRMG